VAASRNAAKLTQAQLAKKVGITREYMVRLEGGHHEPTLTMLVKVARALGVTPGSLID
jgi:putative transcriptional regulator